jgi:hypothetical protein
LDHECAFLLAYFFQGKPHIYSPSLPSRLAVSSREAFATMGCAGSLANFLLTGIDFENSEPRRAIEIAMATVELCKLHDSFCGGQVQIVLIGDADGSGDIVENAHFDDCSAEIASSHTHFHRFLVDKLFGRNRQESQA